VRTVLGDVEPESLRATYCHEHLLTQPAPHVAQGSDLVLDDEEKALVELARFREAGGGTIVEVTTREYGREARGLARLSKRARVHVVATTGHVSEEYWRGMLDLDAASEAELGDEFVGELLEGIESTGSQAGVIKVGTSRDGATATERKVIRAAACAQRETGAPITTHTTAGTAMLEQATLLERAGVALDRVCVGHVDRRLVWDEHLELARRGTFLGYDCISKQQYETDAKRADFVLRLAAAGHGRQILLSGDLARRGYLESWGGRPGYRYILERFLPLLRARGFAEEDTRALVVDNPRRLLAWR
jgi:predicted metal-dependent phosphotriesterase family hydrolase